MDREVLGDPEWSVLAAGGRILCAIDESDRALDTVALMRYPAGEVELTKMAVDPAVRGGGIGRKLITAALAAYEELGAHRLFLASNPRLEAALKLYESVGFRYQTALRPGAHVERADVYMIWEPTAGGD